jgi:hypothetical protein
MSYIDTQEQLNRRKIIRKTVWVSEKTWNMLQQYKAIHYCKNMEEALKQALEMAYKAEGLTYVTRN